MIFVNPLLLAGTALVALPIVLHLMMRRKPRWVEFPALRFVRRRHDTNRRQLRLRHLLLLLLRAAIIALVAMALARPSLRVAGGVLGGQRAPVAAAVVIDTSKRMDYRHENRTRLEAAKELALWLLAQFPPESQVAVITSHAANAANPNPINRSPCTCQKALKTTPPANKPKAKCSSGRDHLDGR